MSACNYSHQIILLITKDKNTDDLSAADISLVGYEIFNIAVSCHCTKKVVALTLYFGSLSMDDCRADKQALHDAPTKCRHGNTKLRFFFNSNRAKFAWWSLVKLASLSVRSTVVHGLSIWTKIVLFGDLVPKA